MTDATDSTIPTRPVEVDADVLTEAERAISDAIAGRDISGLRVLGFGEISVAVGWPTAEPELVLKRTTVFRNRADCERNVGHVANYVEHLTAAGASVLPTTTYVVERPDGRFTGYVAQPLVPKACLAETVIANDDPRADHPLVLAHRAFALRHVTPELSVDLQITNFAWDGERLTLLDITSPFTYDSHGQFNGEIPPELPALMPAFMRPKTRKEVMRVIHTYRDLPKALALTLVLLYRIGQDRWVPAFAQAFNEVLDEPVDLEAVVAEAERYKKVIPFINRSARLQRWWVTKIRRGTYDAFITDSFNGELL